jgi:hypothetical protein
MSGIPVKLTGNAGWMNYEMQHEKMANDIVLICFFIQPSEFRI